MTPIRARIELTPARRATLQALATRKGRTLEDEAAALLVEALDHWATVLHIDDGETHDG